MKIGLVIIIYKKKKNAKIKSTDTKLNKNCNRAEVILANAASHNAACNKDHLVLKLVCTKYIYMAEKVMNYSLKGFKIHKI